jgi:large subunit ribosomal protein L3
MGQVRGILGTKLGMTQIFEDTRAIPVTVIQAGPCVVAQLKTEERDGYRAVQLTFGDSRRVSKPMQGHFDRAGADPGRYVVELRTDVVGVSKGKGFAGVMKRHGFSGLSSSHGTERKHRSPGAVGACATPSRVFKGMRMAGQMGNERVTVLNLEVVQADPERNLLLLKGAIPGPEGGLVMVRSAVKAPVGGKS